MLKAVKDKALELLDFANLLDQSGKLSITNVGLIVLLARVAIAPQLDWASVTTLALAFANYMQKRQEANKVSLSDDSEAMKAVKAQYETAVAAQAKTILDLNEKIKHIADAVKVVDLSRLNLRK